ncbi:hypothetical protein SAMN05216559_2418 [Halomicrobium zhouii]|uniref:DUF7314 domain-containing protein n=1 Tax=Halomicrobium zhouii TaxID=767519 RepID=A0A1I6LBK4_9EURY|nr:hypothetical protein [Halomicrobium zhouii]SFS00881.1 hypothetical protein SAMN05216559_2418 [Halomicrobium zhouii]
MADEFAKGFGIFVVAGLGWMTLAGWYRTPSFEGTQLTGAPPEAATVYDQIGLFLEPVLFWFMILGPLTFWILIPIFERARESYAERAQ